MRDLVGQLAGEALGFGTERHVPGAARRLA
jgi:hypothetical protein